MGQGGRGNRAWLILARKGLLGGTSTANSPPREIPKAEALERQRDQELDGNGHCRLRLGPSRARALDKRQPRASTESRASARKKARARRPGSRRKDLHRIASALRGTGIRRPIWAGCNRRHREMSTGTKLPSFNRVVSRATRSARTCWTSIVKHRGQGERRPWCEKRRARRTNQHSTEPPAAVCRSDINPWQRSNDQPTRWRGPRAAFHRAADELRPGRVERSTRTLRLRRWSGVMAPDLPRSARTRPELHTPSAPWNFRFVGVFGHMGYPRASRRYPAVKRLSLRSRG